MKAWGDCGFGRDYEKETVLAEMRRPGKRKGVKILCCENSINLANANLIV